MHNNYHFFRRLVPEIRNRVVGLQFGACFSQQKDELILGLFKDEEEFYIKADLKQQFSCLYFPATFTRAKKNSVDLFTSLVGRKIDDVIVFNNERCFAITSGSLLLLFKMFGNRSNIILFEEGRVIGIFKNQMTDDWKINSEKLHRSIKQDKETFLESNSDLLNVFPTFGKLPTAYLKENNLKNLEPENQWNLVKGLLEELNYGRFYIINYKGEVLFSLVKIGEIVNEYENPLEAINEFYSIKIRSKALFEEKKRLLNSLTARIKKSRNYISKSENKLANLSTGTTYRETADIIMANLHNIPSGSKKVNLYNFYSNQDIEVSLNERLSPQKNAEKYYRKAKNQKKEQEMLSYNIKARKKDLEQMEEDLNLISVLHDLRKIRDYSKTYQINKSTTEEVTLPYKQIDFDSFEILIGKNAKANDELTFYIANKKDLWLHARDVSGSHVIIRHKPGQNVPGHIIEKAAGLAAYNSKRKNDSLTPVIYVERKNVRKFRGAKPGQVRVDHEQIIMVRPLKN